MAFTEAERVDIRKYLGFPALFQQANPRLEFAMTAVQSTADGGIRPDGSTEALIRKTLGKLATLEDSLEALWTQAQALTVDELKIDPARGMMVLRAEGRRLVGIIAVVLNTVPRIDVFSSGVGRDEPV